MYNLQKTIRYGFWLIIEENPFAVAVLTTATMITVLIVGIRSRSGKRGDSHKGEK